MNTREKELVRGVLGRIGDQGPRPVPFEDLDVLEVRKRPPRPGQTPAAWVAAAVALVVVGAAIFLATSPRTPVAGSDADIFFVAGYVPDGLVLADAGMSGGDGFSTTDPEQAIATHMAYLEPGQDSFIEGDRALIIDSLDLLAQTERLLAREQLECFLPRDGEQVQVESEDCRSQIENDPCFGVEAINSGTLNASACVDQLVKGDLFPPGDPSGEATVEEITVRGKPAVLVTETRELYEVEHTTYSISVFEGGPVVVSVSGHGLDLETTIRVAESLESVTALEYLALQD